LDRNKSSESGLSYRIISGAFILNWDRPFDTPVALPYGPPALTLREAAEFIKRLPETERDRPEWRLAIQMLIDAAEDRGPMLFARVGLLRAAECGPIASGDESSD